MKFKEPDFTKLVYLNYFDREASFLEGLIISNPYLTTQLASLIEPT